MAARKTTKPAAEAVEEAKTEGVAVAEKVVKAQDPVREETVAKKPSAEKKSATTTKSPAKKAAGKKETADKEPAKKGAADKEAETAPAKKATFESAMHLQFAGKSYTQEDLEKIARDVWTYDLNQKEEDLVSLDLYVKPEENLVYYVMNREFTGSFYI